MMTDEEIQALLNDNEHDSYLYVQAVAQLFRERNEARTEHKWQRSDGTTAYCRFDRNHVGRCWDNWSDPAPQHDPPEPGARMHHRNSAQVCRVRRVLVEVDVECFEGTPMARQTYDARNLVLLEPQ